MHPAFACFLTCLAQRMVTDEIQRQFPRVLHFTCCVAKVLNGSSSYVLSVYSTMPTIPFTPPTLPYGNGASVSCLPVILPILLLVITCHVIPGISLLLLV